MEEMGEPLLTKRRQVVCQSQEGHEEGYTMLSSINMRKDATAPPLARPSPMRLGTLHCCICRRGSVSRVSRVGG
jgi:hypothetical protein